MISAEIIAKLLLDEKAVFLRPHDPFTWTSGIKSPIYCDNRLLISSIESRKIIIRAFVEKLSKLGLDLIAGTATAGIPWAAWISYELNLPLIYVRSSSKEHGRQNAIEGKIGPGQKCALIEDLISTGKSSLAAANRLKEAQIEVETVSSIFTYDFPQANEIFYKENLKLSSLSNFEILAKVAYDSQMLNQEALQQVLHWRESVQFR